VIDYAKVSTALAHIDSIDDTLNVPVPAFATEKPATNCCHLWSSN
jgi:hypothetical protein